MRTTSGDNLAVYLSEKDEAIFREYSKRTGVHFDSLIQSSLCDQIAAHKDTNPFDVLPELLTGEVTQREVSILIHPLVSDFADFAASQLGVNAARLIALAIKQEAFNLSCDFDEINQDSKDDKLSPCRLSDVIGRAHHAAAFQYLISLPSPLLATLEEDPWRVVEYKEEIKPH